MENSLVFVLLLLCSFSSARRDRDKDEDEIDPCLADIHAVLRNMTSTLTEYKIEIERLRDHNKDRASTCIFDMLVQTWESCSVENKRPKLESLKNQSSDMGSTLQEQEAKLETLEKQSSDMGSTLQAHESDVKNLKTQTNETKTQVEALFKDKTEQDAKLEILEKQSSYMGSTLKGQVYQNRK
ncbi:hypothetical protein WMY93_026985 [Mugilogobius chulae]|uniref:Uncharacterized protein n=1 Tax=Mugilogobius chulae TaxID=88201 RepID=A0AAW0MXN0_9GOBI